MDVLPSIRQCFWLFPGSRLGHDETIFVFFASPENGSCSFLFVGSLAFFSLFASVSVVRELLLLAFGGFLSLARFCSELDKCH